MTPGRLLPLSALRAFLASESAGGRALMIAACVALFIANSALAPGYRALLAEKIGPLSIHHWINDALMALFFLLVGLEIKREWIDGKLARAETRRLPVIAAAAGMAVPALVYLAVVRGDPGLARGWAIPCATDIAFALAMLGLAGRGVPAGLRLFLTTVAIVDDIGAVAIIALAYTRGIDLAALGAAALIWAAMLGLGRMGVTRLAPYLALAAGLWLAVLLSGVHATIAGVLAAFAIPLRASPGRPDDPGSPLHRLEHALAPWVSWGVLPLFGLANAGVSLAGAGEAIGRPLPLAIALGLFVGKQAGVLGSIWLAARLGIARPPQGARWMQVYGIALLSGIGFTMSLFIGGLAFGGDAQTAAVKLGVLAGSLGSAIAGVAVLRLSARRARATP